MENNRVLTINELIEEKNKYQAILNKEAMEYMESLINLEVSVLRQGNINSKQEELLSELRIFRDIAMHNIFNRTLSKLNDEDSRYKISTNEDMRLDIFLKTDDGCEYQLYKLLKKDDVPTINLYESRVMSPEEKAENIKNRTQELKKKQIELYQIKMPYIESDKARAEWKYAHTQRIEMIEQELAELKQINRHNLKEEHLKRLLISANQREMLEMVLLDANLTKDKDFKEINPQDEKDNRLIKKYPHSQIIINN